MYIPSQFKITDEDKVFAFIRANAFGQLISLVDNKLFSTHIPFMLDEENTSLICHLAKQNPQWAQLQGQEILITFQGPHDYVSPSWYNTPGVPTWNYQSVHVYGTAEIITAPDELSKIVNELTDTYESTVDKPQKPDYTEAMLNAIVGIKIKMTDVQCKFKLSQNRPEEDRLQVIDEHNKRGATQLSDATKNEL